MTATDELRRLLDERGVEWKAPASYDGSTKYDTIVDGYWFHEYDGRITVHGLTPEQAIAATLGRGECHDIAETPKYSDKTRFECSACGYEFSSVGGFGCDYGDSPDFYFCPNCGRKVVTDG